MIGKGGNFEGTTRPKKKVPLELEGEKKGGKKTKTQERALAKEKECRDV